MLVQFLKFTGVSFSESDFSVMSSEDPFLSWVILARVTWEEIPYLTPIKDLSG